jgi:hypothetical protein
MRDLKNEQMHLKKQPAVMLALILILISPLGIGAQQAPPAGDQASGAAVTPIASANPLARLLPGTLAGLKATSDIKQLTRDNLVELVADKVPVYQEYRVTSAASREYAGVRVDVFETQTQFAALGLFMFNSGAGHAKPIEGQLGSGSARLDGELVFWKGTFFVRVGDATQKSSRGSSGVREALARAVADGIVPGNAAALRPPLLDSLPAASLVPGSQRYFLGPESLNAFLDHGREMFEFDGDTEAVMGHYWQGEGQNGGALKTLSVDQTPPKAGKAADSGASDSSLTLLIVECHTPQFATDAMARVTSYISSLPEADQQRIVFKRTGNYVVEAVNVQNREYAEGLVSSVQYPYTVKWLRDPLWPANDPFRMEKAANMLLSTFGLLGLILITVLALGTVFGTTVFLKRRKQQREVFSDAGGMLRLDIEPFESVILGLPPKSDN